MQLYAEYDRNYHNEKETQLKSRPGNYWLGEEGGSNRGFTLFDLNLLRGESMVGGDRAHESMTQRNVLLNGRNQ